MDGAELSVSQHIIHEFEVLIEIRAVVDLRPHRGRRRRGLAEFIKEAGHVGPRRVKAACPRLGDRFKQSNPPTSAPLPTPKFITPLLELLELTLYHPSST